MTFEFYESGYWFKYSNRWSIIKYDDHRFYRRLSGLSFSGVDFAGVLDGQQLYLIEVKNYSQYPAKQNDKPVVQLGYELAEKVNDSLALIQIIHKYHSRKFWFRLFFPLVLRFPFFHREWIFWEKVYNLTTGDYQPIFILFIESTFDLTLLKKEVRQFIENDAITIKIENLESSDLSHIGIDIKKGHHIT